MSRLEDRLGSGALALTAELPVVDGGGVPEVERRLEPLRDWVDAVNVTDNTAAHAHASPLAVAVACSQSGVEPVMQLVCRDRNRLALQSEIVGASMHGIENLCCLTGDAVSAGDEPEARPVFELSGTDLVGLARTLSEGRYLSGRALDPAPHLFIGAVETTGAPPFEARLERVRAKADAGARFLQLQIGFVPSYLEGFMEAAEAAGLRERVAFMPSISILRSARALRFLDEKVPGVDVPAEVIARVEQSADPESECFELACQLAAHALSVPGVAGLHLISFRPDAAIAGLCERIGVAPLAER
ncbi:MAG TPA: methylenetetrahydrofolate reductase [Thermoleophilaceae bacterium]|jgi:methylenetetrahydrofolate reductase (NADPH)